MDIKDVKDLIITMDKTNIEKIEIEKSDFRIMISKKASDGGNTSGIITDGLENSNILAKIADSDIRGFEGKIDREEYSKDLTDIGDTFIVKSPIVGTFFKAPSPDELSFVTIGDTVEKGQILCIIEAMKIMNEIECEYEGQVLEIFVEDESIVEFGQPLMLIGR
ncbi:MAG: acetyl-CoA carboxylase biotin carboxyl carrier protein [Alkaliphilus sp.]|nr:acetyl-CoA carboxylase biotin carboxyl carrier protein [Alkaliphilus sp.]